MVTEHNRKTGIGNFLGGVGIRCSGTSASSPKMSAFGSLVRMSCARRRGCNSDSKIRTRVSEPGVLSTAASVERVGVVILRR